MSKELGKVIEVGQEEIPNLVHNYIKTFTNEDDINMLENELETVDTVKNDIKAIVMNTETKKERFIKDIRSDLGKVIKDSKGVGVKRVEKPKENPVKKFFASLFAKF